MNIDRDTERLILCDVDAHATTINKRKNKIEHNAHTYNITSVFVFG